MIGRVILANILHRPVRTVVSIVAVGVEVALVIIIVGLTSGMIQETAKRIEGVGRGRHVAAAFGIGIPGF